MTKLYKVIFEDRDNVYREFIPAQSATAAARYIAGNGEIVATQDVTEDFPLSLDRVSDALKAANFGKVEQDLILRMIQNYSNTI